jgi:snRNA-activating protein complex (SNAPc), subunit 3
MDHIYPTKDYKEYVIKEEVPKLREKVTSIDMPASFEDISRVLKLDEEELKKRSLDICKIYEDYGNDKPSGVEEPFAMLSDEALELNFVKLLRGGFKIKEGRRGNKSEPYLSKQENGEKSKDMRPYQDSIITVRFYETFKYFPSMKNQPRFHQEYQVLGSNFLTELRDLFYCPCNYGPFFDISENPTEQSTHSTNQSDPGFFYVHDTFYNDLRNPENSDYSEIITKWLQKLSYVREFKKASMAETKFEDLRIRIGYPCVYQHHGACEHLFCITSVDLIDSNDSLLRSDYPKLSFFSNRRPTLCDICTQTDANYLVTNCALHVKDPLRVCENCFFSFHYIDRTTKTCEFKAYRIISPVYTC